MRFARVARHQSNCPVLAVLREIDLFGGSKGCLVFLIQLTDGSHGTTIMVAQTESTWKPSLDLVRTIITACFKKGSGQRGNGRPSQWTPSNVLIVWFPCKREKKRGEKCLH